MSKRLTKRLPNGGVMYDNGEYWAVCYPRNEHCLRDIDRMAIKLCDLEDKIEQGDVVEVVRCKDCKHNPENGGECDRSITHTGRDYVCEVNTYRYIGIDYCSYGERREENER